MKVRRLIALMLCVLTVFTMAACGADSTEGKQPAMENPDSASDNVIFDQDGISVKIDGIHYQDYFWYLDATVENHTDQAIVVYGAFCTLNGYAVGVSSSIKCDANSTAADSFTLDKGSLCYAYELCGLSTVDNVGMTLNIYADDQDDNPFNDVRIVGSKTLEFANIEPFTIVEEKKEPLNLTSVYDDGAYKVSVITVDKDFYELSDLPMLYLLVENNSSSSIGFDFLDEDSPTYEDIINSLNFSRDYLIVNDQTVECVGLINDTSLATSLVPGSKTVVSIEMYLEEAGLQIEDISSIKRGFEIYSLDTETYLDTLAIFMLEYTK